MAVLPENISQAWDDREGPVVLSTVNSEGTPNAIYATCVSKYDDATLLVANNYFSKTLENILAAPKGTILFMTKEGKAYQVKGNLTYHTEGEIFENMKTWNPEQHPGHGAAALNVEEVYAGAEKIL